MIGNGELESRSRIIAIYALCGFANIGSMGIQVREQLSGVFDSNQN